MPVEKTGGQPQETFEEAMRRAEQEAGVPPDDELYAEFGGEHPEPDETGRVPSSRTEEEPPVEPAPEPEPEPEVEVQAEAEPDPLAELNKKVGQLVNDNAELRRQLEAAQQPQQPEYQTPPLPMGDVSWFDEMAEANPAEAAYWALQNQQPLLYDRAVRAWYETDPVAAGRYERQIDKQVMLQEIAPHLQKSQEQATRAELEQALQSVASRHDDFVDVIGSLDQQGVESMLNSGLPVEVLQQGLLGTQAQKEQVFETFYRWRKADVSGQLVKAAQETQVQQTEEAKQAKKEAFVGSSSTTTPDEVPQSEQERLVQAWKELTPSLRDGWTGRDSRQRLGR